jgi:hypothetical protein
MEQVRATRRVALTFAGKEKYPPFPRFLPYKDFDRTTVPFFSLTMA